MINKRIGYTVIALFTVLILNLPVADSASGDQGIEKISNEWGTQSKGNAYGLQSRDTDVVRVSGLASETSAAPLPPALAVLALIFGIGLKALRGKRRD